MPEPLTDQGWAFPSTSRKAHYFRGNGVALCDKWASLWMPPQAFEPDTGKPSRDDCVACRRKLEKEGVRSA